MTYTLAFVIFEGELLLINREKAPWTGCWNGLGGKIEPDESPIEAAIRELKEEAGLDFTKNQVTYKGKLTWNTSDDYLYLFVCDSKIKINTPLKTREGILDYKKLNWILDDNLGVAHNIPYFIETVLFDDEIYDYHCIFEGNQLLEVKKKRGHLWIF